MDKKTKRIRQVLEQNFCDPEVNYTEFISNVAVKLDTRGYNIPMLYIAYTIFSLGPVSYQWMLLSNEDIYSRIHKFLSIIPAYIKSYIQTSGYYDRMYKKQYSMEDFLFDVKVHIGYVCWTTTLKQDVLEYDEIEETKIYKDKDYATF
jgi:hypothetical protein